MLNGASTWFLAGGFSRAYKTDAMTSKKLLALWVVFSFSVLFATALRAEPAVVYASPNGEATGDGSERRPLNIEGAQKRVRALLKSNAPEGIEVRLRAGVYALAETLVFSAEDSGKKRAPVRWKGVQTDAGDEVVFSGGSALQLEWQPWRDGIWRARVPESVSLPEVVDQLFVNGERQVLARYPNYSARAMYLNGVAADVDAPERVARWKNPACGFIHALHKGMWGGFHYAITGKNANGTLALEGGWQNNRGELGPNLKMRYVEGVFEELDAPGEWFFERVTRTLYFFPPDGVDLRSPKTRVVVPRLESLVRFEGARFVEMSGVTFAHTTRTFMKTREPVLRSDWCIYRGGAVFFENAEGCSVVDCDFAAPGGNAVFVSNRNRDITISGCRIYEAGASGVVFLGNPAAARSPLFHYGQTQPVESMDRTPGPKSDDYPANCVVTDCLITRIGRVEKQSAGVCVDLASRITVSRCSIYDVPRAGINIGDGCWGGHVIEGNDVFETVLETNDHGAFNSWGRDRFWERTRAQTAKWIDADPGMAFWDARETVTIRDNRFRCDHGWDIDLDDGSTNYVIENNLCLSGGIKLREGYRRVVRNNITLNSGIHLHVWYPKSGDTVTNNLFFSVYTPIGMPHEWGGVLDGNFLHKPAGAPERPAVELQKISGADSTSISGDARFVSPKTGDYRLAPDSPVFKTGFRAFPLENFGVTSPRLKALARTPIMPELFESNEAAVAAKTAKWDGATIKNLTTLAEQSATGMLSMTGVFVAHVGKNAVLEKIGVMPRDVILRWGARPVENMDALLAAAREEPEPKSIEVWRDQEALVLKR